MLSAVLLASGCIAAAVGGWRGYLAARSALLPFVGDSEPTRILVEASRPLHERARVRRVARGVAAAVGWLAIAMYGLYLATVGMATA